LILFWRSKKEPKEKYDIVITGKTGRTKQLSNTSYQTTIKSILPFNIYPSPNPPTFPKLTPETTLI
jgi:hypothetical protein